MALQSSGAISLNDVHIELDGSSASGTTVSLNDTDVRALVGISSGEIELEDFYGASAAFSTTITEGVSHLLQQITTVLGSQTQLGRLILQT